jgi:hypothetical protein
MPIKGLILIVVLAIIIAVFYRTEIYSWLESEFSDLNDTNDDNFEEEQKE